MNYGKLSGANETLEVLQQAEEGQLAGRRGPIEEAIADFEIKEPNAKVLEISDDEDTTGLVDLNCNAEQWEALHAMLNRPAQDKPRLRKLLTEPSVFEQ